jgi:hypothetical protein
MTAPLAALLLGLPVSESSFATRAQDPHWDWGRQIGMTPTSWKNGFQSQAHVDAVAAELIADARSHGDAVVCCASLGDLEKALSQSQIVVLFAHWRGSAVVESDLLKGWEARARQLAAQPGDLVGLQLRDLVEEGRLDRRAATVELNRAIESRVLRPWLPAGLADRVETGELIARTLARDLIDAAFAGCLRQGNRLELFDGLHSLAALERVVPPSFAGVFDLSCCNSSVPASYLKLCRTIPIDVIGSDEALVLAAQMRVVQWALRETHRLGGSYKDIRLECSRQVNDHYRKKKGLSE